MRLSRLFADRAGRLDYAAICNALSGLIGANSLLNFPTRDTIIND